MGFIVQLFYLKFLTNEYCNHLKQLFQFPLKPLIGTKTKRKTQQQQQQNTSITIV